MIEQRISDGSKGFQDVFFSKNWRIAYSDYAMFSNDKDSIRKMEKHAKTDEAFFLLCGNVHLVTAGKGETLGKLVIRKMFPQTLYVVERGEWHVAVYGENARVLIVEDAKEFPSASLGLSVKLLEKIKESIS